MLYPAFLKQFPSPLKFRMLVPGVAWAGSQPPPFHLPLNIFPILKLLPRHRSNLTAENSRLVSTATRGAVTEALMGADSIPTGTVGPYPPILPAAG